MDRKALRFEPLWPKLVPAAALLLVVPGASAQEKRDEFYWLGELNKTAAVMVVE